MVITVGLGKWAVIDLETTGIDPHNDQVIDVGFLQFEGVKLVRQYSSLVANEYELSQFIQKLTGITPSMLKRAPSWEKVQTEITTLEGHYLVAHNSKFEEGFLAPTFEEMGEGREREEYVDSLLYLGLLHVDRENLNLESFIIDLGIREKEDHRGLADSLDLLKVMLVATYLYKSHSRTQELTLTALIDKYHLKNDWWGARFFALSLEELAEIGTQIEFSVQAQAELYLAKKKDSAKGELPQAAKIERGNLEFSGKNLQQIFQDQGKIQSLLPFYSYRKSQEDMALKTGQSFKNKVHALIQAPTGTGKTLGYFIPSTLFALENREQVLVATGTKTLQHQAHGKDVPEVRGILGLKEKDLKVTMLLGSNNHLCELLYREKQREEDLFSASIPWQERFALLYFDLLFSYNREQSYDHMLTRGDVAYSLKRSVEPLGNLEKEIAVDFRACMGSRCPFKNECSYLTGLREAKESHLILGNHSLMFSWPKGFPRPRFVVVDEAHRLEKEATSAFTKNFTQGALEGLIKNLTHLQGVGALFYLLGNTAEGREKNNSTVQRIKDDILQNTPILQEHLEELKTKIELYFKKGPRYSNQFWNEVPMPSRERVKDSLEVAVFNHLESVQYVLDQLYKMLLPYLAMWEKESLQREEEIMAYSRFENFMASVEDLHTGLTLSLKENADYARSLKFHGDFGFETEAAPINVGQIIHDQLLQGSDSVVFTSATLAGATGEEGVKGMEWATGYLYLPPEKRFKKGLFLPPVYDYEKNSKVYLCDDTPALYSPDFVKKVLKSLNGLLKDLGGRSLILFSARSRFEEAREILLKEFSGSLPVFIQGMGNNVVEEYKASPQGILLGMESFGEGIDIPGDALQFVFIDKIPDLRQDLVTTQRREFYDREFGQEFNDYYLASRTRALHQKLGRLLRTVNDRGGAIIVDSRVVTWKPRTMESFMKMMKPYAVERAPLAQAMEGVLNFIKGTEVKEEAKYS